jgi:hypothetical protein
VTALPPVLDLLSEYHPFVFALRPEITSTGIREQTERPCSLGACRKAGVVNKDYLVQKALLAKLDKGELQLADPYRPRPVGFE